MGLSAVGICWANVSHLPSADSMRTPDMTAIATLRTINTAEVTLLASLPPHRYGTISDLVKATLLDRSFEAPPVGAYTYDVVVSDDSYVATATPSSESAACWEYYSTQDAKIFYSDDPRKAPNGRAGTPAP
jgi:hypothetical protein